MIVTFSIIFNASMFAYLAFAYFCITGKNKALLSERLQEKKRNNRETKKFPDGHLCCCHFFKPVYTYDFCGGKAMQFLSCSS